MVSANPQNLHAILHTLLDTTLCAQLCSLGAATSNGTLLQGTRLLGGGAGINALGELASGKGTLCELSLDLSRLVNLTRMSSGETRKADGSQCRGDLGDVNHVCKDVDVEMYGQGSD